MAQLTVVVALTRDGGVSLAGKALRTPLAQWLGRLSMALYLVHMPVIAYLCLAVSGGPDLLQGVSQRHTGTSPLYRWPLPDLPPPPCIVPCRA